LGLGLGCCWEGRPPYWRGGEVREVVGYKVRLLLVGGHLTGGVEKLWVGLCVDILRIHPG